MVSVSFENTWADSATSIYGGGVRARGIGDGTVVATLTDVMAANSSAYAQTSTAQGGFFALFRAESISLTRVRTWDTTAVTYTAPQVPVCVTVCVRVCVCV